MKSGLTLARHTSVLKLMQRRSIESIVFTLFIVSAAFAAAGLGAPLRLAFPIGSLLIAAWLLMKNRTEQYIALTLWLYLLTPGLRRFVDLYAGWSAVNSIMLAPYLAASLCALPVFKLLYIKRFPYSAPFALILACVIYGHALASFNGRSIAGLFDVLRWGVPPCFGLFIALQSELEDIHKIVVLRTLTFALILLSSYGVYQYFAVPAWDALWMRESQLTTIGIPEPFQVRVFSTMNSPGSFASYLVVGLILITAGTGMLRIPAFLLALLTLLLTLVRTSWVGLLLGMTVLTLFGASKRIRIGMIVAAACLPVTIAALENIPDIAKVISTRLSTLGSVQSDGSFLDRTSGYDEFFNLDLPSAPFGNGFATNGSYQSYLDHRPAKLVDGAIIEIGMTLGSFAGSAYFLAVLIIMYAAARNGLRSKDPFRSACGAVVIIEAATLTGGMVTVGEIGIMFWMAAGFCLISGTSKNVEARLKTNEL